MMTAIGDLLEAARSDPLPSPYVSSHWLHYGSETVVERRGDDLVLEGKGFGFMYNTTLRERVLNVLERLSYARVTVALKNYHRVWRAAKRLARELSFDLTFDVWRQAVALAVLADHWESHRLFPATFAMIGDGYGFLGALVRRVVPHSRLYCIDLPKILVFQARAHEKADAGARQTVFTGEHRVEPREINFVFPRAVEEISEGIDCAINIASMQEMNEFTIETYFRFLRRRAAASSRFYCVNRLRKGLSGGEVTHFYHYPWREDDEIFVDGPCPYYSYVLRPTTLPNGPRFLGRRIPFVNYFDGVIVHRLVHLAPFKG